MTLAVRAEVSFSNGASTAGGSTHLRHRRLSLLLLSATVCYAAIVDSWAAAPPKNLEPAKGTFLVASPRMADPRFSYSVILMLEHGEDGSLGLIINKATKIPLSRVLPDLDVGGNDDHTLYLGGPVGRDFLMYLTRHEEPPERSSHLMGDVYFGGDKLVLEQLIKEKKDDHELRLFSGHSGWAPGQLASELARKDWKVIPADAYTVFERDLDQLWLDLIEHLRPREDVARGKGFRLNDFGFGNPELPNTIHRVQKPWGPLGLTSLVP